MNSSLIPVSPRIKRILNRRRSRLWKLRFFSGLITAGFIFFILLLVGTAAAFGYFAKDLPSPNKLSDANSEQSTKIFDRNGVLLYNVYGSQNRTLVTIDRIPQDLKNATIAIEDKNFYRHQGFDLFGYLRVAKELVTERKLTGGSTLTQQLVKTALLSPERTVTRKIKEFILAVQIERKYSKDEILQIYLNEIPYGGTAWGVEAAANQYFAKHVWELNLVESAVLAGLPQKPTAYSPFGSDPKAYVGRTTDVLRRMREEGFITSEQEKKAVEQLEQVKFASFGQDIKAPHFSLYVKELLEEKYGAKLVQEGGLRVTTSLDSGLQDMAQEVVRSQVAGAARLRVGNGAAVIENVKTGEILAWVGSKDYFATDIPGKYDIVSQALRQPGSALKPFNYLTGFKEGYSPATMYIDILTDFGGYKPTNYAGTFNGPSPTRSALGNSLNIPAVKALAVNGLGDVLGTLKDFGITTLNEPDKYGLSLTLGGGAVKLLELTNAYAILGNEGKHIQPTVILKVTDSQGNVLEEFKPPAKQKQLLPVENIYQINHVLADKSAKNGFGAFWAGRLNFRPDIASKTGTSELKIDNWAFGYSPSLAIGVWVGNNDNSPMHPSLASGVTGAAPIYYEIGSRLFQGRKIEEFKRPEGIVFAEVDATTGMKPGK
jgi:penicillin-binding protein 1C